jgi:thioredoxin-related protein
MQPLHPLYPLLCGLLLLLASPLPRACDDGLTAVPAANDWAETSALAREQNLPILLLFSADGCHYCERLKGELLNPLLAEGGLQRAALVREIDINAGGKVSDFDGILVRTQNFVSRYQVFATPTVLLVDPRGEPLGQPIVGYDDKDGYAERLREAITLARLHLDQGGRGRVTAACPRPDPPLSASRG